jgi:hypothetical protein
VSKSACFWGFFCVFLKKILVFSGFSRGTGFYVLKKAAAVCQTFLKYPRAVWGHFRHKETLPADNFFLFVKTRVFHCFSHKFQSNLDFFDYFWAIFGGFGGLLWDN